MTSFAKVAFDFVGQLDGELSVNAGDVLVVIDPSHVAEGWIKVQKREQFGRLCASQLSRTAQRKIFLPSAPF